MLKHYYHIFCGTDETPSTQWPRIVNEHFDALEDTGLIRSLDYMGIGIVGKPEHREEVKNLLNSRFDSTLTDCKFEIIAEEDLGWEQVTLRAMDLSEPAAVLYCHSKGAAFSSVLTDRWRISMINCVIYDWQRCVEAVTDEGLSSIGAFWRPSPWYHYSGTYWWSNTDHLKSLPPFIYDSRWEAEAWIGRAPGLYGDIGPGHPATDRIERGWSYREGTVKFDSRGFGYRPGLYHDIEVTRLMQAASDTGHHLTVIESHPAVKRIKITERDRRSGPPV